MAHAASSVKAAKRLYVSRVFLPLSGDYHSPGKDGDALATQNGDNYVDGHARLLLGGANGIALRARFPGKAGNVRRVHL